MGREEGGEKEGEKEKEEERERERKEKESDGYPSSCPPEGRHSFELEGGDEE